MKICITSKGKNWDSVIDERFGRASYFIFIDSDTKELEAFENQYLNEGHGVGTKAAQFVVNKGAKVLITANPGPNATQILNATGIKVIVRKTGTIQEIFDEFVRENN